MKSKIITFSRKNKVATYYNFDQFEIGLTPSGDLIDSQGEQLNLTADEITEIKQIIMSEEQKHQSSI